MNELYRRAIVQSVVALAFLIGLIYTCAGTWHYGQGWLFLGVFSAVTTAFTVYLAIYDKPLLARRMQAGPWHEHERAQRVIVSLIILAFFAFIVLPVLDYRLGLSRVPPWVSVVGDAIIVAAYVAIFWVVKANSWAAANVRVEAGQTVIDTGPYAYVRHPMYAGAVWLFVGMPLALGSWWTVMLIVPVMFVLRWRMADEERVLSRELAGYTEYMRRVRYRIVPTLW